MLKQFAIFLTGLLFSFGLIVSGMINPAKVIGFLDVFGQFNPSLGFVMLGAVLVTTVGYKLVLRKSKPLLTSTFSVPNRTDIDKSLLGGAVLFGVGWGLVGLCPGPAIAAFAVKPQITLLFFLPMLIAMYGIRIYRERSPLV